MARILSIYESPTGSTDRKLYTQIINTDNQIPSASYPFKDADFMRTNGCVIDPISGHLVVAYIDPFDNYHGVCKVYESVGESYIVGSKTKFYPAEINVFQGKTLRTAHIPNSNKIAFVFESSNQLFISIGEVIYGNYELVDQWYVNMIGSPVSVTPSGSIASLPSIVFDSTTNQLIIAYSDYSWTGSNTGGSIYYRLCSIDNAGVVSFGDIKLFTTGNEPVLAYDSISKKVVVIYYSDTFRGEAVVGTVSGTDIINISSPKSFYTGGVIRCQNPAGYYASVFDPNLGKIYIAFTLLSGTPRSRLTAGKITANSISFETPFSIHSFKSYSPGISMAYDSKNKVVVGTYGIYSNPNDNNSGSNFEYHSRAFAARFPVAYTSLSSSSISSSSTSSSSRSSSSSSRSSSSRSSSSSSESSSSSSTSPIQHDGLSFLISGDADWYKQSDIYNSGTEALQSGSIGDNQSSRIDLIINASINLSFYWKVSSESGFDFLEFYINGVRQTRISGNIDWTQLGPYTLTESDTAYWRYVKDGSVLGGSDCGWLDTFEF